MAGCFSLNARIQKVMSEGVQMCCCFFFVLFCFSFFEGIEDPNTAINGPSSARQRNAILMAFRWRADVDPTLNAGSVDL